MGFRFFHAADLHLDSPLRGLERYSGAPVLEMRGATRRAFSRLVDTCLQEEVKLLLLAGDVYDGNWKDYNTGLFFVSELNRLREIGAKVVLIRGNHDAESVIRKNLRLPAHVHELSSNTPEVVRFEDLGVCVVGQSFAQRDVTADLAATYPVAEGGLMHIGLLHTSLDGREGHAAYAPTRLAVLESKGYEYWALGHVHKQEVVREKPWVVFPGNLQGRHAKETGPKGGILGIVEGGHVTRIEPRECDVARWVHVELSLDASANEATAIEKLAAEFRKCAISDKWVASRVSIRASAKLHASLMSDQLSFEAELRAQATGAGQIWLEKVLIHSEQEVRAEVDMGVSIGDGTAYLEEHIASLPPGLRHWDTEEKRQILEEARLLLDSRLRGAPT